MNTENISALAENIGPWHNPDNVPAEKLGQGWRFMLKSEVKGDRKPMVSDVEFWLSGRWIGHNENGSTIRDSKADTYRTRAPIKLTGEREGWTLFADQFGGMWEWSARDPKGQSYCEATSAPTPEECFEKLVAMHKPTAHDGGYIADELSNDISLKAVQLRNLYVDLAPAYKKLEAENAELRKQLEAAKDQRETVRECARDEIARQQERINAAESAYAALRAAVEKGPDFQIQYPITSRDWILGRDFARDVVSKWSARILAAHPAQPEVAKSSRLVLDLIVGLRSQAKDMRCQENLTLYAERDEKAAQLVENFFEPDTQKPDLSDEACNSAFKNLTGLARSVDGGSFGYGWRAARAVVEGTK